MSDKEEAPSSRRMPFDASGRLLPDGPEHPTSHLAPDIKGLPWDRRPNREWTMPDQRALVLDAIKTWMAYHRATIRTWKVVERDNTERSAIRSTEPTLVFTFVLKDGWTANIGASFPKYVRDDKTLAQFATRIHDVGVALQAMINARGA